MLASTRPTAVNLFWGIRRMRDKFSAESRPSRREIQQELIAEAQRMLVEDIAANRAMGNTARCCCPPSAASSPIAMPGRWRLPVRNSAGRDPRGR